MGSIRRGMTALQRAAGEKRAAARSAKIRSRKARKGPGKQTVSNPKRNMYPGIYDDPVSIVNRAGEAMAPVNPLMKDLFGVTRRDLDDATRAIAPEFDHMKPLPVGQSPSGAPYRADIDSTKNTNRIRDVLSLAKDDPRLEGSYGWYMLEPLKEAFIKEAGVVDGMRRFDNFLQRGSVLSAASDVSKEIRRASLVGMLDEQGRAGDFIKGNMTSGVNINKQFPDIFRGDIGEAGKYGHPYHSTSHRKGLQRMQDTGKFYNDTTAKSSPKTPAYYHSKTGENLEYPTADAHFMRGIGAADVRPTNKGGDYGKSISSGEAGHIRDYFKDKVAKPLGMEGSPAQALMWNAMAKETGVTSKLSKPYLELVTDGAEREAKRLGVPVKQVLSDFIMGRGKLGAYGGGAALGAKMINEEDQPRGLLEM